MTLTRYAPLDMGNGREGVEFTGILSVPAGTSPFEVLRELRDLINDGPLTGDFSWLLEDLGLWPEPAGRHAVKEGDDHDGKGPVSW